MGKAFSRFVVAVLMVIALGAPAFASTVVATIDRASQTMTITRGGQIIHQWAVSTARRGYTTPAGSYRPTRLHKMWYSRKYDMSPMPYSVFFRGGYAIHGTSEVRKLGRPASHGCVRLHTANARAFYSLVREVGARNTRIVVH